MLNWLYTIYILGYDFSDNANFETLTQYETTKEADYNTEEWCIVEADSLEEAKGKYEETFIELKKKGLINGCM
jgi:hypothetical protein